MIPRTVLMAQEVAAQFTPTELENYGNIILNGYATQVANTINKKAWQYAETLTPPINLPTLTVTRPALKGWTTNYQEYYTQLQPNGYGVNPGDPTMFEYSVHSFSTVLTPGIVTTIRITNPGSNYTVGYYPNLPLTGGTGAGLTASITVTDPGGPVTGLTELSQGAGYPSTAAVADVTTNALTGSGSGLLVNLFGTLGPPPYGAALSGIGSSGGVGYRVGDTVEPIFGSGTGAVYQVTAVTSTGGSVVSIVLDNGGNGYTPGDLISAVIPGGVDFSAQVVTVEPTAFAPRWAQPPHRFYQNQVSPFVPPNNNPQAIAYSFMYPVADSLVPPPIDVL
jgi:hypothetical protein